MVKHNNIVPNVHLRKHWESKSQSRFRVHLDQPAKKLVRMQKRQAKTKEMFPRPLQKLRPVVSSCTRRYAGKVRYGRGFALDELKAAGLSAAFARTVGISVDHRRSCTSEEQKQLNVERLNTYKSKLILFPRKDGKVKKGLINDSTAEKCQSAAASTQPAGHVLPRAAASTADEFAAITKELKEGRAHSEYRNAWANARYKGRREKRAADEEAAKK